MVTPKVATRIACKFRAEKEEKGEKVLTMVIKKAWKGRYNEDMKLKILPDVQLNCRKKISSIVQWKPILWAFFYSAWGDLDLTSFNGNFLVLLIELQNRQMWHMRA